MLTQSTQLDFKGQNIFVGIDVHLKNWTVTILTEELAHKTFTQTASAEAGFSGFWAHYKLIGMGINNIITNPADVPVHAPRE